MLAKSEFAFLTVTVLGTLAAWLAVLHPSLVSPTDGPPSIACSGAVRSAAAASRVVFVGLAICRQHDPVAGLDRPNLVTAVGVEGDEREG